MNLPSERTRLLAADAKRALDGLVASLTKGPQGMPQGAMHARDLAVALAQVGLDPVSSIVDDVARQMTLGQPGVLQTALHMAPFMDQALSDLNAGLSVDAERLHEQWLHLEHRLHEIGHQGRTLDPASGAVRSVSVGTLADVAQARFGETATALANATYPPKGSEFSNLRLQGLRLMQQARIVNAHDDDRSVRQMDALLSELQDWSLRLGQKPLSDFDPRFHHALQDAWVDEHQFGLLSQISAYAHRASGMDAQSRSLTVFMEWHGLILNEPELEQVSGVLRKMRGQVRATQDGYRLVFPSSLLRMRVVPFMLKGQRYAVAAAQYVQFEPVPDQAEGVGKILLRSGQVTKALLVDRVLPAANANITPIPDLIEHPDWLVGVMVGHQAEIHLCISPI